MRIGFIDYFRFFRQLNSGFRANHEYFLARLREEDVADYLDISNKMKILDLANGRLRPQYTILKNQGCQVVGIDLINQRTGIFIDFAYSIARRIYSRKLNQLYREDLSTKSLDEDRLICGNVNDLPFTNETFELITSIAAFEHFLQINDVLVSLKRVLKNGGIIWACIHLFTSPSGAHNINIMQIPLKTLPRGVDPWDHLREKRIEIKVPLNKLRLSEYLDAFASNFEILKHYCAMREGEHLLTPEIEAELSDYSREELTCGAYVILARKP